MDERDPEPSRAGREATVELASSGGSSGAGRSAELGAARAVVPKGVQRRFWRSLGLAALVLILGSWLSSGTLAPYGMIEGPCRYRINIDHEQFRAPFRMIEGQPAETWNQSVVLRRILHPILAYPFVKLLGFELGGFVFNIVALLAALIALALAVRRFFDARAAVLISWLFATYPGYAYWVGLPYSYGLIVPGCVACVIALLWVHEQASTARIAIAACVVGVVGLGYDLVPYFGGALLLMLALRRRWWAALLALVIVAAWALFTMKGLPAIFGFPARNANTEVYAAVVGAYADAWNRLDGWGALLLDVPKILLSNFLFSNFVMLPLLLVWLVALRRRWRFSPLFHPVALCVLLSTLAMFLFLNMAPAYDSAWQIRGTWIARVFQPWFVAVLVLVAATSVALREPKRRKLFGITIISVVALNAAVIAGPFIGLTKLHASVNERFYQAGGHNMIAQWLDSLGRRPYGFCRK